MVRYRFRLIILARPLFAYANWVLLCNCYANGLSRHRRTAIWMWCCCWWARNIGPPPKHLSGNSTHRNCHSRKTEMEIGEQHKHDFVHEWNWRRIGSRTNRNEFGNKWEKGPSSTAEQTELRIDEGNEDSFWPSFEREKFMSSICSISYPNNYRKCVYMRISVLFIIHYKQPHQLHLFMFYEKWSQSSDCDFVSRCSMIRLTH